MTRRYIAYLMRRLVHLVTVANALNDNKTRRLEQHKQQLRVSQHVCAS